MARTLADEFLAELSEQPLSASLASGASALGAGAGTGQQSARDLATVLTSNDLKEVLAKISAEGSDAAMQSDSHRSSLVEDNERRREADLIARCNQLTSEIANQIALSYQWLQERYERRFPELATAVLNPIDYAKCVTAIGETDDLGSVDLSAVLPAAAAMVVRVTVVSTRGRVLPAGELTAVLDGAAVIEELEEIRQRLMHHVESRMFALAPNLSQLLGTRVAARLVNAAGGIAELSKIPANYLQSLGSKRSALAGFSSAGVKRHTSILYDCDLVDGATQALQTRVLRLVTGKAALTARVDASSGDKTGESGARMRRECQAKIDKWMEPPPSKVVKPLPAPKEQASKKRGGRRARAEKRRLGMTEMRKQANRMSFAEQEEAGAFTGMEKGWGMLGGGGGRGKVRLVAEDRGLLKKFKQPQQRSGSGTSSVAGSVTVLRPPGAGAVGGATSSVVFGNTGGVELAGREIPLPPSARAAAGSRSSSGMATGGASISGLLSTVSGVRPGAGPAAQSESRYFGGSNFSAAPSARADHKRVGAAAAAQTERPAKRTKKE